MPPRPKKRRAAGTKSESDLTGGAARDPYSTPQGERPPGDPPKDVVGSGEFRGSADRRIGLISGIKGFGVKRVTYATVSGIGIFEGDIALGTVNKLVKTQAAADAMSLDTTLS